MIVDLGLFEFMLIDFKLVFHLLLFLDDLDFHIFKLLTLFFGLVLKFSGLFFFFPLMFINFLRELGVEELKVALEFVFILLDLGLDFFYIDGESFIFLVKFKLLGQDLLNDFPAIV